MKTLRLIQQVGFLVGGTTAALVGTARMAEAGTFVGAYQFDDYSLTADVAAMAGVDAPALSNFGYQKTDSQNGTGDPIFSDGSREGAVGASDRGYQANRWNGNTADNLRNFFQFGLTPQSGTRMSLTQMFFNHMRRSESGPSTWELRSSLDGYGAAIASGSIAYLAAEGDSWLSPPYLSTIDFGAQFTDLSDPIMFRLYAYGSSQWNSVWRVDNVELEGTVSSQFQTSGAGGNPLTPVPTPAALPALVGFGWGLWRQRRGTVD
jgi:hypothetical protein